MAKIYAPPAHLVAPEFSNFMPKDAHKDMRTYREQLDGAQRAYKNAKELFLKELRAFCQKEGKGPDRGEEIFITVGDGAAWYMVFTPTSLIHVPIDDGYSISDAHARGIRAADIKEMVKAEKAYRATVPALNAVNSQT